MTSLACILSHRNHFCQYCMRALRRKSLFFVLNILSNNKTYNVGRAQVQKIFLSTGRMNLISDVIETAIFPETIVFRHQHCISSSAVSP